MRIKEYRKSKRLSQAEVAEILKVSQSTIYLWESGKGKINEEQLRSLALLFGCTVNDLNGINPNKLTGNFIVDNFPKIFSLDLFTTVGEFSYPISPKEFENVFDSIDPYNNSEKNRWLHVETLDNKYLIINPNYLINIEMVDDDAEAAPPFENEEIYNQLLDVDDLEIYSSEPNNEDTNSYDGNLIKSEVIHILKELSEDQKSFMSDDFKVITNEGSERGMLLRDDNWYKLLNLSGDIGGFFMASEGVEDGRTIFINQKHIVLIEVPKAKLKRFQALDILEK